MNTREDYIGIFDSGLGGISVLRHLRRVMPEEKFLYFGDSANAPYGTKTKEEVRALTFAAMARMMEKGLKAFVVACNTATSAAVNELRAQGIKVGLFRPITVWPFPEKALEELAKKVKRFLVVENNAGQMVIEVKAHAGNVPVDFLGRFNGSVVDPDEVLAKLKEEA